MKILLNTQWVKEKIGSIKFLKSNEKVNKIEKTGEMQPKAEQLVVRTLIKQNKRKRTNKNPNQPKKDPKVKHPNNL